MTIPFLDIIGGVTEVSSQLLELYKIRRDGSFFEQQTFLSELREHEADKADERAAKREVLLARLGKERIHADHIRSTESQLLQARLSVALQRELQSDDRRRQNAPYSYDNKELRSIVQSATNDGRRPALLIAPFFNDELSSDQADTGPPTFRVAIRRSWINCPWSEDVAILDGLLSRPLRNTDLDMHIVRNALRDLPVILVCGDVQQNQRVWCSVVAWDFAPPYEAQSIQINLPPLPLPPLQEGEPSKRLDFEDALGWAVAVTVGLLAEWFHLISNGRAPRLHRSLLKVATDLGEIGPGIATAYDVAISRGVVDETSGRANQAIILAESGYNQTAIDLTQTVVRQLQSGGHMSSPDNMLLLHGLATIADRSGDRSLSEAVRSLVELESKNFVLDFLNLREGK